MIISGAGCRIRSVGMVSAVSLMYEHSGLFSPRNTSRRPVRHVGDRPPGYLGLAARIARQGGLVRRRREPAGPHAGRLATPAVEARGLEEDAAQGGAAGVSRSSTSCS